MSKTDISKEIQANLDKIQRIKDEAEKQILHVTKPLIDGLKARRKELQAEIASVDKELEKLTGKPADKGEKPTSENIVALLAKGAKSAKQISEHFNIGYQTAVKRLNELEGASKVSFLKDGKTKVYSVK